MTHVKAWKLVVAGLGTAAVAVAIAVPLALAGGGDPSNEQIADTDLPTLGVPAPGFAGKVDEMIVGDGPGEPLFIEGEPIDEAQPGATGRDLQGIAVGEPVPGGIGPVVVNVPELPTVEPEIVDKLHEVPNPRPVREPQS